MKSEKTRMAIITGNHTRHRYFSNRLVKKFEVLCVVSEQKRPLPVSEKENENEVIKKHFADRALKEATYFAGNERFTLAEDKVLIVPFGESNSRTVFDFVTGHDPELVIIYGCSIIKPPLLTFYDKKMINMHLGLSPYYRGAGTNFWPLVNNEPECVGATIHLPTLEVDAGAILGQIRPDLTITDTCHDIGCKTIISGTDAMVKCIGLYCDKGIEPVPQTPGGKVYRNKDFNAEVVLRMWRNFENNMIGGYLENKKSRDGKHPIVER